MCQDFQQLKRVASVDTYVWPVRCVRVWFVVSVREYIRANRFLRLRFLYEHIHRCWLNVHP